MAIPINDKLKPRNDAGFAIVDANDVEYQNGRLPDFLPICVTQDQYDAWRRQGKLNDNTPYLIIMEEEV